MTMTSRVWAVGILLMVGLIPLGARALTVSPPKIELTGDPGTTISGSFLIINEQEDTKKFYTTFENFEAQGETGTPKFTPGTSGLGSWMHAAATVVIAPGEEQDVPYTINIPKNAEPGGHFGAIFLGTSPPESSGDGQVSVGAKVGVLVFLRVSGAVTEGANLLEFQAQKRFVSGLPITLFYRIQNGGGDRLKPHGEIVVRNTFGLKSAQLPANKSESNVLPLSTRKFMVVWSGDEKNDADVLAAAPVEVVGFWGHVKSEWNHFAFGLYTAKMSIVYNTEGDAVTSKARFFVFSWQLVSIVLLIAVVVGWGGKKGIARYNRWIIAKARTLR